MNDITSMENKYKEGETVHAKENPAIDLKVRRYVHKIYYCRKKEDQDGKDLVYFERELIPAGAKND